MPVEVIMPKVDMDMTHGTLAAWHVAEGDEVRQGAALFDIETDKAAMEVEAPASGRLGRITAGPGDRIPVGTVVAMIFAAGEDHRSPAPAPSAAPSAPVESGETPVNAVPSTIDAVQTTTPVPGTTISSLHTPADETTPPGDDDYTARPAEPVSGIRATPAARALARRNGLSLEAVEGTGPRGRIQREDIESEIESRSRTEAYPSAPTVWSPQSGPLHVTRRPGEGVPLVLVHGFAADSQSWAPLEKALGPSRPLVRIDLPGHGRSPRRPVRSFGELARMLVEAFDSATQNTGPVHLVGHSLGGALALSVADLRARRIASLSLISPAGLGPEIDAATLSGIVRASRPESLGPWLRRLAATPDAIGDDYVRAAMRLRESAELRHFQADLAEVLFPDGTQSFDLRPALSRLETPTCILWGRRDGILPNRHALAAKGEIAIHLFEDTGHIPQFEAPDRVAAVLRRHMIAADAPA